MNAEPNIRGYHTAALLAAIASAVAGLVTARDSLLAPAFLMSIMLLSSHIKSAKGGRVPKKQMCYAVVISLALNLVAVLLNFPYYTAGDFATILLVAPSFVMLAYMVVIYSIAYTDFRADRLIMTLYVAMGSFCISSAYTYFFAFIRLRELDEINTQVANIFLNASSFTVFAITMVSLYFVNRYMIRHQIKLLYPRHVSDGAGEGGK